MGCWGIIAFRSDSGLDAVETSRWMEATLKGLLDVQSIYGKDMAKKVCELAQCPYPFEMQVAAKYLQNGYTSEAIHTMTKSGKIKTQQSPHLIWGILYESL